MAESDCKLLNEKGRPGWRLGNRPPAGRGNNPPREERLGADRP